MNGQPESEQLQNFHERLNQWVSSQGFWFQLRYSFSGGGAKGALLYQLLRMASRVLVLVVVLAIGTGIFLLQETGSESYREKLEASFKDKLRADEVEMQAFSRENGEFEIGRMALSGSENTFFTAMEIRNMKCRMGMLERFRKVWEPGLIEISRLDLGLRAGADSQAAAKSMGEVLFQETPSVKVDAIQVADMSMHWGYSERTNGSILGSRMYAQRLPDSWRLKFRGGTFTQNWLRRLEIVEMDVVFGREGIVFEKAVFKKGEGFVTFEGLKIKSGQRPEVSGKMTLRKLELASLVPAAARNFVEGTLSGEFRISGSTNSTDGLVFEGDVEIGGEDVISLRDRVHLLKALSVVDAFNNYRRLDFRKGAFHLVSKGGEIALSDVDLTTEDKLTLKGDLTVRVPSGDEIRDLSETGLSSENPEGILTDEEISEEIELTLRGAAEVSSGDERVGFGKSDASLFDRLGLNVENRRNEEKASERLFQSYRYDGKFIITLPKEAFSRAPVLAGIYPVDENTGRIPIKVPIDGTLYDLTLKQADEIYKNGTR